MPGLAHRLFHEHGRVIDNRHISMVEVFTALLPEAKEMDMAVGYFLFSGLEQVYEPLQKLIKAGGTVRILMGSRTTSVTAEMLREGHEFKTAEERLIEELRTLSAEDARTAVAWRFSEWISQGQVEVRVYVGDANYFHAKSYLLYRSQGRQNPYDGFAIVGSSNFSKSGLLGNTELNTVSQDNFGALSRWFRDVWESDEVKDFSEDLLDIIDEFAPTPSESTVDYPHPKDTYAVFARHFAARELEEIDGSFMESLYKHQAVGVSEMKLRLELFGTGCLCDGVGLGKTRTAAATLMAMDSESALIVAPAKLHDQWINELDVVGVPQSRYRLIGKEWLSRQKLGDLRQFLHHDLIVVDEAHQGLKSDRTSLYRNLAFIKAHSPKNVRGLLLTATPWNNSRSDVFNLGRLFLNRGAVTNQSPYHKYLLFSARRASKAIETDDRAFAAFWRDLFLQRTRKTFGGQGVTFARRNFPVVQITYEPIKEKAFAVNYRRIGDLRLPYMHPVRYLDQARDDEDFSLDRLKLLFLKRADSSWPAFRSTLTSIMDKLESLQEDLTKIKNARDIIKEAFSEWLRLKYELDGDAMRPGESKPDGELEDIFDYERISWQNRERYRRKMETRLNRITHNEAMVVVDKMMEHCNRDLDLLEEIRLDLEAAFERKDEKYEAVGSAVKDCLEAGEKVLLITQFRDTAVAYYERLLKEPSLSQYRMALVTGVKEDWKIGRQSQESRENILERFSPIAKGKPEYAGTPEEVDLVIGTETLAIGQNLQDARVLMNLDLPFNPMNLEQRIGRIDRPRQDGQVSEVDIYTFPSMPVIESELKMMERLRRKLEGIYQDTQFDDLVLPHYQEFLQRVLQARKTDSSFVEAMVERTVEDALVPIVVEEHSLGYVEAQQRMRKAILDEPSVSLDSFVLNDVSLSRSGKTTAVVKICLRDVNGREIEQYFKPIMVDEEIKTDLVAVEEAWHNAKLEPIRDARTCPKDVVEREKRRVEEKLMEEFLRAEVQRYNEILQSQTRLEKSLTDSRVRKVIADIQDAIQGVNKEWIARQIRAAGYHPKSIRNLIKSMEIIDLRYDHEEAEAVNDLYTDLDRLWGNYGEYYELFVEKAEVMDEEERSVLSTARMASYDHSSLEWVVGNLQGVPEHPKLFYSGTDGTVTTGSRKEVSY